jgi:hypothetical protein
VAQEESVEKEVPVPDEGLLHPEQPSPPSDHTKDEFIKKL